MVAGTFAPALIRIAENGGHTPGVHRGLAILYYNSALDHYFVTASPEEQHLLDAHHFNGWYDDRDAFTVAPAGSGQAGLSPVCRFYGLPEAHLDSHFYSASRVECAEVEKKFAGAWQKESDNVYEVYLPDPVTGACPPRSRAIYRVFNGRADANHYYGTAPYSSRPGNWTQIEGYGPPPFPVAMCAPIL